MNFKILNLFLVLVCSSVFSLSPDDCGGFIILNGTFELTYKVSSLNTTNETGSTCVWVIRAPIGSIGFNLTRLDLDSKGASSGVSGILSIQQGIQSQQNFTTSRVIEDGDLDKEIIANETWTILVFRHFSSDSRIQGEGFQMRLRQVPRKILPNDFVGVHADFLGGQMAKMNDSRFVFPNSYGQPLLIVVNSRHGKSLHVVPWTLLMKDNEFVNVYQFSKQENKFVFMTKLEFKFKGDYYGTLKADEDQPILLHFHTTKPLQGNGKGLHISYSYENLTPMTSNSCSWTTISRAQKCLANWFAAATGEAQATGNSGLRTILMWVGLAFVMLSNWVSS